MPQIFTDFEQKSERWWAFRRGLPTCSEFASIITPKTGEATTTAALTYIYELIGQLFDPDYGQMDEYASAAMREGSRREAESRKAYQLEYGCKVQQVGFVLSDCGRWGGSPDGLIGDDEGLEAKNPDYHTQVRRVAEGILPAEYKVPIHAYLTLTGRKCWNFYSYCPASHPKYELPTFRIRVEPDEYTAKLKSALDSFLDLYQTTLTRFARQKGV